MKKNRDQLLSECQELIKAGLEGYIEECKMYNVENPNTISIHQARDVIRDLYQTVKHHV